MKSRQIALAAVAAAALAVSACSTNSAPKAWDSGAPSPVGATVAAAPPVWVTPPWTGKVNENNSRTRDQYGGTPTPGIVIAQQNGNSSPHRCTLGAAVRTAADQGPAFLTAGHCDENPGNPLQLYPTADVSGDNVVRLPRPYAAVNKSAGVDAAVVPLAELTPAATVIAGRYRVAGVLTAKGTDKLVPLGTTVCVDGAVSGLHCGPRLADEDKLFVYDVPTVHGDSGGPVFVVDDQNRAALIGIVWGGEDVGVNRKSAATYLESALLATGTAARLDPGVVAFDAPEPGLFSRWIAPQ